MAQARNLAYRKLIDSPWWVIGSDLTGSGFHGSTWTGLDAAQAETF
jgi:hypothetical protein